MEVKMCLESTENRSHEQIQSVSKYLRCLTPLRTMKTIFLGRYVLERGESCEKVSLDAESFLNMQSNGLSISEIFTASHKLCELEASK